MIRSDYRYDRGLRHQRQVPPASFTRRRCCPTARCWWQGKLVTAVSFSAARNYTTLPAGVGAPTGSLNIARSGHTTPATLLPNGNVLVAGGGSPSGILSSAAVPGEPNPASRRDLSNFSRNFPEADAFQNRSAAAFCRQAFNRPSKAKLKPQLRTHDYER